MFRFSIRDLLLLTVIVALGLGWALDRRQLAIHVAKEREFKLRLHEITNRDAMSGALDHWQKIWGEPVQWRDEVKDTP